MVKKNRKFGQYFTPEEIFSKFIFPEIETKLYDYKFVDLFAGEGNLILPILNHIPENKRIEYFKKHIFLFDIQNELTEKAIQKAKSYGIPNEIASQNIKNIDTLKNYPNFLLNDSLPIYHITNPPYLYIGYIKKHKETQHYLEYFQGDNAGYQDLYQIALINDLKHKIQKMIYIIPTNFLFGSSGTNKIRDAFLRDYTINKAIIFEKKIFENTGINTAIFFFKRKDKPSNDNITFEGLKVDNNDAKKRVYILSPKNHYRAGSEFEDFIEKNKIKNPLNVKFHLTYEEAELNKGNHSIIVIDANNYDKGKYIKKEIKVNDYLYKKIKSNILYVRTIDSGTLNKRAGLCIIQEDFQADGIIASKPYRTHPIQIFFDPPLPNQAQYIIKDYFNKTLEHLRDLTDSEFMTTYKYSNSLYTRKYLGLSIVKKIIETFNFKLYI
jgi:type I restriction-modification system DNA methylase subunit